MMEMKKISEFDENEKRETRVMSAGVKEKRDMKKFELARILTEYMGGDTKYILRLLKPIEVEDFQLYRFDDDTAGIEWRIGYLVRGGKVKELDYGHVIISSSGRILRDEPPTLLMEELAFRNAKIGDVVVIHELVDMLGKDYHESLYYFVIDENLFERIQDKKREIEDQNLSCGGD